LEGEREIFDDWSQILTLMQCGLFSQMSTQSHSWLLRFLMEWQVSRLACEHSVDIVGVIPVVVDPSSNPGGHNQL